MLTIIVVRKEQKSHMLSDYNATFTNIAACLCSVFTTKPYKQVVKGNPYKSFKAEPQKNS